MKPRKLPRPAIRCESFSVARHRLPHFLNLWHYHEELELVFIVKSTGTRFIGDNIEPFEPGDLVLIGSQLPHLWLNDKSFFQSEGEGNAEALVIHFHPKCFGDQFFSLPEMHELNQLLEKSHVGLSISGKNKSAIIQAMEQVETADGFERILTLLNILKLIASEPQQRSLANPAYMDSFTNQNNTRLDTVYEYVLNNFKGDIDLERVAEIVHMNPSAFSRFFSKTVNKTFVEFVNEIRVGFACRLLLDQTDRNISGIAFESGFNSLSNFNKQFKRVVGCTPSSYLESHQNNGNGSLSKEESY